MAGTAREGEKVRLFLFSPLTLTLSPLRGEGTVRGWFAAI
jgi:hypothetical protein